MMKFHLKPNLGTLKIQLLSFSLLYCLAAPGEIRCQGWPVMDENTTFDSIQAHFNSYWEGKKPGRGSGYKPFKRWEEFWKYRLMPDGKLPPAGYNMTQFNDFVEKNADAQNESLLSNWTNLGPSSSNSGYAGIGRVNCIAFHPTNSSIMWAGTPAGGLCGGVAALRANGYPSQTGKQENTAQAVLYADRWGGQRRNWFGCRGGILGYSAEPGLSIFQV